MIFDTMETAFGKAREAQRCGRHTVRLVIEAARYKMALRLDLASLWTEGQDAGCDALVLRRFASKPPFTDPETDITVPAAIDALVVVANVADLLNMGRRAQERARVPVAPVRPMRPRRPLSHLLSR